jgi:hypothetical protein
MTSHLLCELYETESECGGLVSHDRAMWKVNTDVVSKVPREETTGNTNGK